MYGSSVFESLFIRYKAEAVPQGESAMDFYLRNKVPCNLFHKWYKDIWRQLVPVQVEGHLVSLSASPFSKNQEGTTSMDSLLVHIMIDICMTNGVYI